MLNSGYISIDSSVEAQYMMLLSHLNQGKSPQLKHSFQSPYHVSNSLSTDSTNVQKIAIIPLQGLLTLEPYYNYWGEIIAPGTKQVAEQIEEATNDPNCLGVVLLGNSGGGYAIASGVIISAIQTFKESGKTIVGAVEGLCGSLAYEIFSYCDAIIATHNACMIGCIGSQITLQDSSKMYEAFGMKTITIKSTLTPQKNYEIEQALKGNSKPILENWIDPGAADFIASVKANRPNVSEMALKGSTLLSQKALENGLIDDIMNLKSITQKIFGGKTFEQSNVTNQTDEEMSLSLIKLGVIASMLQVQLKNEAGSDLNAEEILDAVQSKLSPLLEQHSKVSGLENKITELENSISSLTTEKQTATSQVEELKKEVAKSLPQQRSEARQQGDDIPPATPETEVVSQFIEGEESFKAQYSY